MRGIKLLVLAIVLAIMGTIAYVGMVTRQSAEAGVPAVEGRAAALEREMAEASRPLGGRHR